MKNDYLERILRARVYDVAIETPLEVAPILSARLGNRVFLKREDMQPVFSFRCRGAYNKMVNLPAATIARGVIASSAGNHAQGVALAAQKLGCSATIVMPSTTPKIKVDAVKARGAEVILHGDTYDEAYAEAKRLERARKLAFVHPYDDPDVIAGQGTIGLEIVRQSSQPPDAVFVPVGGGGLISGIAAYIKRLRPSVKVIGVEPVDADAMARSLKAGRRVALDHVGLFADGVAVKKVGELTFQLCRELLDGMVLVDTDQICAAIKDVFGDTRTVLEPGRRAARRRGEGLRRAHRNPRQAAGRGGFGCERQLRSAALRRGARRDPASIARRFSRSPSPSAPAVSGNSASPWARATSPSSTIASPIRRRPTFSPASRCTTVNETARIVKALEREGFKTLDLSDDEMAKLHVRHLVGGHAPVGARGARGELLYRFEFPERPGALMKFLSSMRTDWNISLFHYRNHGSDTGRVLVGMQVPRHEMRQFQRFLTTLGYPYVDESRNPAYRLFLG